ncbi:hypothetical protein DPMN_107907 [Dreissena polymorpha]|uniref:Uncharacterized protein n=1 Tax=Dreissena polymorpha TaxID=45954 RepID=A0A9D4K7K2_DREPO|nr:hypothetical protein DPMN_107907 [Dreissena polymorpha]
MLSLYENEIFIDPFYLFSPPEKLVNMATGVEPTQDVASSLLNCHEIGKVLLETFVIERFISQEESTKKQFFDPLPRSEVRTMASSKQEVRTRSKSIYMNEGEMYERLLAVNSYNKMPLQRVLSFENAPVPLSLLLMKDA